MRFFDILKLRCGNKMGDAPKSGAKIRVSERNERLQSPRRCHASPSSARPDFQFRFFDGVCVMHKIFWRLGRLGYRVNPENDF
jgi:hypothetical protein